MRVKKLLKVKLIVLILVCLTSCLSNMDILIKEKPRAPIDYTEDDVDLLARTIYGEARDQGKDGMMAVGNVVINRLNKKKLVW